MEQDISNFSSSSSHRLPTVSVAEALKQLDSTGHQFISTGLERLDSLLTSARNDGLSQRDLVGGLARGHITEVYGPPGVGKTTMAMQAAATALHRGGSVVWIDCAYSLAGKRLRDILSNYSALPAQDTPSSPRIAQSVSDMVDRFHHFTAPTLPHLLALTIHPTPTFPPPGCMLVVIDSVSTTFAVAYPRQGRNPERVDKKSKRTEALAWAASRKWAVMEDFVAKLSKSAAIRNFAVLVTSQTTTKIQNRIEAILVPAITFKTWDACINSRIVLFRDWPHFGAGSSSQQQYFGSVRYAAVLKAGGVLSKGVGKMACFRIDTYGLEELPVTTEPAKVPAIPALKNLPLKRKRGEVADSESEDEADSENEYGWDDDEDLLATEALVADRG